MKIKTNDGKTFAGKDAQTIVRKLRNTQWNLGYQPKVEYMLEVSDRVQQMTGTRVPTDAEGFLLGLHSLGLIVIEGHGSA